MRSIAGRVLGSTHGDVGRDEAGIERRKVRLGEITAVGGDLVWLSAEIGLDVVEEGHELGVIARALCQAVREDDLGFAVDGGLRIVALDVAVLGLEDAAFRIGEVALCLWAWL